MSAHTGQAGGLYPPGCGITGGGIGCAPGQAVIVPMDVTPELTWSRVGALPSGQTGNTFAVNATVGTVGYFTFTSRCNWSPRDAYLEVFLLDAARTRRTADIVGIYSCTIDGENILGSPNLANLVTTGLFSTVSDIGCCPKFPDVVIPAMASLILAIRLRTTDAVNATSVGGAFLGVAR